MKSWRLTAGWTFFRTNSDHIPDLISILNRLQLKSLLSYVATAGTQTENEHFHSASITPGMMFIMIQSRGRRWDIFCRTGIHVIFDNMF
jgi:hypothetical protein